MLRSLRTLGVLGLCGLGLGSACTFKDPNEDRQSQGGSGGSDATAGKTNQGGKGGKGGSSSNGGKAGRGNTPASAGEAGSGGEGGAAPQCPGCASGFCLDDGTCVDCLASNDLCPTGNYCSDANECEPGCKADGSTCASGICASDHNCQSCINDDECLPGLVCGNGECTEPCTSEDAQGSSADCGSDLLCCSTHCTDVLTDSQNCGACGTSCGAGQFCGLEACSGGGATQCASCVDTALAGLCRIGKVIVILDSDKNDSDGNRAPGRAIGAALHAQCGVAPVVTEAEQASVEALNLTTGRPVSGGGELLVVAGGPFYQNLEGYLEEQRISPLYWFHDDEKSEYRRSDNDEPVVSLPLASDHDSHDFFIIQFMHDPTSGSLALNAQGLWLSGTTASAFQLEHGILPNLDGMTKAWYAYEWTDKDDDKAPDLDEIVEVASGS